MRNISKAVVFLILSVVGCTSSSEKPTEQQIADHKGDVEKWYDDRVDDLKAHDGWLNLAGLFWLKEGINSFGSSDDNDLIFPTGSIAARAGYFMVKGTTVTLTPATASDISIYGKPVIGETVVFHPDSTNAIKLLRGSITRHGPLEWHVIRRDDRLGIRLRDLDSDGVKNFKGIDRYPIDYSWKVPARFEAAPAGTTIDITNVLGQTTPQESLGAYVFQVDGKEYRLDTTGNGEKLFIVFGDATNSKETYAAGRFIYVNRPDSTGMGFIDFNKAYNPPCVFTEFATCPLPTKENSLTFEVKAGEKDFIKELLK